MPSLLRILSLSSVLVLASQVPINAQERVSPPSGVDPSDPIEVWGHERLTWDQPSRDAASLAELTFIAHVDERVDVLEDVRCSSERNDFGFECSSRLPRMTPGPHTIGITATDYRLNRIGEASPPLNVVLRVRTTLQSMAPPTTAKASSIEAHSIIDSPIEVADLAALPDGTVVIGEARGRILTSRPGSLPLIAFDLRTFDRTATHIELLALTVAPNFTTTRSVFAAYATERGLRLVRFTESNGVFTNHAILREGLPIGLSAAKAAVAVGPDEKIYLAIANQLLRLNLDGSTPADGPDAGLFSAGVQRPEKLAWNIGERILWLLGSTEHEGSELRAIALGDHGRARAVRAYDLGRVRLTSIAVLPATSLDGNRLVLTSPTTGDLLQWRTSDVGLDEPSWLTGARFENATAMVEHNGALLIGSRSGLFRVDTLRR